MNQYNREIVANISQDGIYVTVHGEDETDQRVFNVGGNLVFASNKSDATTDFVRDLSRTVGKSAPLEKIIAKAEKVAQGRDLKGKFFVCGKDARERFNVMARDFSSEEGFSEIDSYSKSEVIISSRSSERKALETIAEVFAVNPSDVFQFGVVGRGTTKVLYNPQVEINVCPREYKSHLIFRNRRQKTNGKFYSALMEGLNLSAAMGNGNDRSPKTKDRAYSIVADVLSRYLTAGYGLVSVVGNRLAVRSALKRISKEYASSGVERIPISERKASEESPQYREGIGGRNMANETSPGEPDDAAFEKRLKKEYGIDAGNSRAAKIAYDRKIDNLASRLGEGFGDKKAALPIWERAYVSVLQMIGLKDKAAEYVYSR